MTNQERGELLHRIAAAIAATPDGWSTTDLRVLDRHRPVEVYGGDGRYTACEHDEFGWPCPDYVDLSTRYGITG